MIEQQFQELLEEIQTEPAKEQAYLFSLYVRLKCLDTDTRRCIEKAISDAEIAMQLPRFIEVQED